MNIYFVVALSVYIGILLILSIIDMKKVRNFTDYAVAGKNQNLFAVTMTLLATVIGASTTIGITDTVYKIGFPGVWWLAFGSIGLIGQSVILSAKVRRIGADTLPDLAGRTVCKSAEILLAFIIVISWIGVVAGQLSAMNGLITFALGRSSKFIFVIVTAIVVLYTFIGGQMSVIRTDRIQLVIIFSGVILACGVLYAGGSEENVMNHIELINEYYKPANLISQLFVIGGVYFIGPDIMSRNFISKNEMTARKSSLIAGIVLLVYAVIITFIGMWVRYNVSAEMLLNNKALLFAVGKLPPLLGIFLIFGLLSAVLSSTDTCLINAASIFVKDILHRDSVWLVRISVCVIGVLALILALIGRGDIIKLLTGAYSIYTPGVICPLTIAILAYEHRRIRSAVWMTAVGAGGIFGLIGTVLAAAYLPLIGMGVSLVISIISVDWSSKK